MLSLHIRGELAACLGSAFVIERLNLRDRYAMPETCEVVCALKVLALIVRTGDTQIGAPADNRRRKG